MVWLFQFHVIKYKIDYISLYGYFWFWLTFWTFQKICIYTGHPVLDWSMWSTWRFNIARWSRLRLVCKNKSIELTVESIGCSVYFHKTDLYKMFGKHPTIQTIITVQHSTVSISTLSDSSTQSNFQIDRLVLNTSVMQYGPRWQTPYRYCDFIPTMRALTPS